MDLRKLHSSAKIAYSLRTRSKSVAVARVANAACKLNEYWYHLRSQDAELPGRHYCVMAWLGRDLVHLSPLIL